MFSFSHSNSLLASFQTCMFQICNILTEPGAAVAYEKLAKFNSLILEESNQTCMDYSYKNMIKDLRNATWSSGGGKIN